MSEVVLASLIAALGGIVTAAISAFAPILLEIIRQQPESRKRARELEGGQQTASAKGEKGRKPGKGAQPVQKSPVSVVLPAPKTKINWQLTAVIGFVSFVILFLGGIIILSVYATPPVIPAVSLSAATVEFHITGSNRQIIIPAGGTLDTLRVGDQVNIEVEVKDANGLPYPNPLAITYYFSTGTTLIAQVAPYLVRPSDTINVKIEDPVTGEAITRIMRVRAN